MNLGMSYNSAMNIADSDKLIIIDKINSIEQRYKKIKQEKEMYENRVRELEESLHLLTGEGLDNSNDPKSGFMNIQTKNKYVVKGTVEGELICKNFQNYNNDQMDETFVKTHEVLSNSNIEKIALDDPDEKKYNAELGLSYEDLKDRLVDKKTKFMSPFINIFTEYISNNVYVTRMLVTLNDILTKINSNDVILDKLSQLDNGNPVRIGISFKGGNVYKLVSDLIKKNMEYIIFSEYFDYMNSYFKKSDCDFDLLILGLKNGAYKRIVHTDRTDVNVALIGALQYTILNAFRNEFLKNNTGYEFLGLCGKNDILMTSQISVIVKKMTDVFVNSRVKFESRIYDYIVKNLNFIRSDTLEKLTNQSNKFNAKKNFLINIKEDKNKYVLNNTIALDELYQYILFQLLLMPQNRNDIFNVVLDNEEYRDLQREYKDYNDDGVTIRELRVFYNTKDIVSLTIGNNNYPLIKSTDKKIYDEIMANTKFTAKQQQIVYDKLQNYGRLTSNRFDFWLRFDKTSGTNSLEMAKLKYEKNDRMLATPFYITINKEITDNHTTFNVPANIPDDKKTEIEEITRRTNMDKLAKFERFQYGAIGYTDTIDPNYTEMIKEMKIFIDEMNANLYRNVIDFGLSRLLVSCTLVCEEFDGSYYGLPLTGEFVDMSYAYANEVKGKLFDFDRYVPFAENANEKARSKSVKLANDFSKFINDIKKSHPSEALDIINAHISGSGILMQLVNIILDKANPKIGRNVDLDEHALMRLERGLNKILTEHHSVDYSNIYFPKLNVYIIDLYSILSVENKRPWLDNKYAKRLNRYIYFSYIESLQKVKPNNILDLFEELGYITKEGRTSDNLYVIYQNMFKKDVITDDPDSFEAFKSYFRFKQDVLAETVSFDNETIGTFDMNMGGFDSFLHSYHLLDFIDLKDKPDIGDKYRLDYIIKREEDLYYIKVNIADVDIDDAEIYLQNLNFANAVPVTFDGTIDLDHGIKVSKIIGSGKDKDFYDYLFTCEKMREKLTYASFNYIYNLFRNFNNNKYILPSSIADMLTSIAPEEVHTILNVQL